MEESVVNKESERSIFGRFKGKRSIRNTVYHQHPAVKNDSKNNVDIKVPRAKVIQKSTNLESELVGEIDKLIRDDISHLSHSSSGSLINISSSFSSLTYGDESDLLPPTMSYPQPHLIPNSNLSKKNKLKETKKNYFMSRNKLQYKYRRENETFEGYNMLGVGNSNNFWNSKRSRIESLTDEIRLTKADKKKLNKKPHYIGSNHSKSLAERNKLKISPRFNNLITQAASTQKKIDYKELFEIQNKKYLKLLDMSKKKESYKFPAINNLLFSKKNYENRPASKSLSSEVSFRSFSENKSNSLSFSNTKTNPLKSPPFQRKSPQKTLKNKKALKNIIQIKKAVKSALFLNKKSRNGDVECKTVNITNNLEDLPETEIWGGGLNTTNHLSNSQNKIKTTLNRSFLIFTQRIKRETKKGGEENKEKLKPNEFKGENGQQLLKLASQYLMGNQTAKNTSRNISKNLISHRVIENQTQERNNIDYNNEKAKSCENTLLEKLKSKLKIPKEGKNQLEMENSRNQNQSLFSNHTDNMISPTNLISNKNSIILENDRNNPKIEHSKLHLPRSVTHNGEQANYFQNNRYKGRKSFILAPSFHLYNHKMMNSIHKLMLSISSLEKQAYKQNKSSHTIFV